MIWAKKRDGDRNDVESDKPHSDGEHADRQQARFAADTKIALSQRQAMQFAQGLGHSVEVAPENNDVPGLKLHPA